MIKLNKLNKSVIREEGEKDPKDVLLDQFNLKLTLNFNEQFKNRGRFFIDHKTLIKFIKSEKNQIRTINYRLKDHKTTITFNKLVQENGQKIHLFAGSYKTLQFDFRGSQINFKYDKNCLIDLSIDNMNWIDIFIKKDLKNGLSEQIHISLIPADQNE